MLSSIIWTKSGHFKKDEKMVKNKTWSWKTIKRKNVKKKENLKNLINKNKKKILLSIMNRRFSPFIGKFYMTPGNICYAVIEYLHSEADFGKLYAKVYLYKTMADWGL